MQLMDQTKTLTILKQFSDCALVITETNVVQLTLVCYLLTLQFSHSYLYHEDHHGGHEKKKKIKRRKTTEGFTT